MKRAPNGGFAHSVSGYNNYGCRCSQCRAGKSDSNRQQRVARRARLAADPTLVPHGRESTYGGWGCRCRPCTTAWSQAEYRRYRRRRAGAQ
jgi:hypothetical protein